METTRQKQSRFAYWVAMLILKAIELGYEVTLGEAWRPPETAKINADNKKGIKNSLHIDRLAIDLNLFLDGKWLQSTEDHRELGEWWESQGDDHCWGGRFGDGNHYSFKHEGRK